MKTMRIACFVIALMLLISPWTLAEKKPSWWQRAEKEAIANGYLLTTVQEVLNLTSELDDLLIVDVRPDYEFEMGHIHGAVNLEFHLGDRYQITEQKKRKMFRLLGKDRQRPVVIYCRSYS